MYPRSSGIKWNGVNFLMVCIFVAVIGAVDSATAGATTEVEELELLLDDDDDILFSIELIN